MNEKIHVLARSTAGKVEPIQFIFKNQQYTVGEVLKCKKEALKR